MKSSLFLTFAAGAAWANAFIAVPALAEATAESVIATDSLDRGPAFLSLTPRLDPPADPKAPPPPPEDYPSWLDGWKGTVEAGINGSAGNTEVFNLRAAFAAERVTQKMKTTTSTVYTRATESGAVTKNRWELNARNDWNLGKSPWIVFAQGRLEYDDFQDWDWRLTLAGGVGYKLIDTQRTSLIGRVGLGTSKEFGGSQNAWIPEGLLGVDFSHQITERQKIFGMVEYYPSLKNFPRYRLLARAGYEILVDPSVNMFLKIGAEDRYDSNPGDDKKKNDVDYFLTLGWAF